MILWASLNMQSIGALFLAGMVPGIMIGLGLMAMNYIVCVKRGYDFRTEERFSFKNVCIAFYRSFWALVMPLIILGGIVTGLFTATEAGVVAIMYGFFYGALFRRSLKINRIPKLLLNAATSTAMVFLIVALGTVFSNLLVRLNSRKPPPSHS